MVVYANVRAQAGTEEQVIDTPVKSEPPFRFFDNREKYLLFVTTCTEKWAIAEQVGTALDDLEKGAGALKPNLNRDEIREGSQFLWLHVPAAS